MWTLLFLFEGILFMAISMPMIRRQIKPNLWYGFRTPKTLSKPEIWYPANEYSGRSLFAAGMLIALTGLLMLPISFIPGFGLKFATFCCLAVTLLSLFWAALRSFRYLSRL